MGIEHRCTQLSHNTHTSDLKLGTLVATMPGAWHNWVSVRTGWTGVMMM